MDRPLGSHVVRLQVRALQEVRRRLQQPRGRWTPRGRRDVLQLPHVRERVERDVRQHRRAQHGGSDPVHGPLPLVLHVRPHLLRPLWRFHERGAPHVHHGWSGVRCAQRQVRRRARGVPLPHGGLQPIPAPQDSAHRHGSQDVVARIRQLARVCADVPGVQAGHRAPAGVEDAGVPGQRLHRQGGRVRDPRHERHVGHVHHQDHRQGGEEADGWREGETGVVDFLK